MEGILLSKQGCVSRRGRSEPIKGVRGPEGPVIGAFAQDLGSFAVTARGRRFDRGPAAR